MVFCSSVSILFSHEKLTINRWAIPHPPFLFKSTLFMDRPWQNPILGHLPIISACHKSLPLEVRQCLAETGCFFSVIQPPHLTFKKTQERDKNMVITELVQRLNHQTLLFYQMAFLKGTQRYRNPFWGLMVARNVSHLDRGWLKPRRLRWQVVWRWHALPLFLLKITRA